MKKQSLGYFVVGILIAFTAAVLMLSVMVAWTSENAAIPVQMIWQLLFLSALCSLINLVYQSERLRFVWKSVIGYILTTGTIITCVVAFGWLEVGGNSSDTLKAFLLFFIICSLFYLITWLVIWRVNKAREKKLNEKLNEYKQSQ